MKPLISVIIPTYNRAQLVRQAVESVLQQRGDFAFDIIVIDDGSTPQTEQVLQRFGGSIRYVRQANAGLNPARNHGLRLARGEFIALLDDDDVWLPFKTSSLLAALRAFPQAGFVHSNFFIWKPQGDTRRPDGLRTWFPRAFTWEEMYHETRALELPRSGLDASTEAATAYFGDVYYWSLFAPMVLPSTAIIRRESLWEGFQFPEVDSVGDWEFFARLSHKCGCAFVPVETTLNRSHEDAVRLTRVDPSLRLRRRIGLIHRLWREDSDFMREKGEEVDRTEAECLRKLARLRISNGSGAEARQALRELSRLEGRVTPGSAILWSLSCIPFASQAIELMRSMRARAQGQRRAAS